MKRLLCIFTSIAFLLSAGDGVCQTLGEALRYDFSAEGIRQWRPEVSLRYNMTMYTSGPSLGVGARIDEKRTLGLMFAIGDTYIDSAPGDVYRFYTGLYARRYFPLGGGGRFSLYSDITLGCGYVYKVDGKYRTSSGVREEVVSESKGDVDFIIGWHGGVCLRAWRSLHFFIGPTVAVDAIGLHLGVGF